MKERPINMRAEEVRAILAGRKTQFRRKMRTQPLWVADPSVPFKTPDADPKGIINCPFGQPGDRLWVRETFIHEPAEYDLALSSKPYREASTVYRADVNRDGNWVKWTPSVRMPRKFSRITLEVVSVRVQRLQDISEEDAEAEGYNSQSIMENPDAGRLWFRALWESINGPRSWEANPWVWAVEFRWLEGAQ